MWDTEITCTFLNKYFHQVLVDDSARLQAAYPGSNAEHIAEQQALVVENWNTLQEKASKRKEQLLAAADLQKFLAHVSVVWMLCYGHELEL